MMTVDQWRQNEAEARQESCTYKCQDCGEEIESCDAFECTSCGSFFCHKCIVKEKLCSECDEKERQFQRMMADEDAAQEKLEEQREEEIFRRVRGQTSHHDSHQRQISWD